MKINELKQIQDAPEFGYMLAYCVKKVLFCKYGNISDIDKLLNISQNGNLLELHLFDEHKEYRAVSSESAVYGDKGFIEHVAGPGWDNEVYSETGQIEKKFADVDKSITILNHIFYDKNGMAYIDDYRLMVGGDQDEK